MRVLNLLDVGLIRVWVSAGIVPEGNSIMAEAMEHGWGPFVLGKVALVGLGAVAWDRLRTVGLARIAVLPAAVLYAFVLGNPLGIAAQVVGSLLCAVVRDAPPVRTFQRSARVGFRGSGGTVHRG